MYARLRTSLIAFMKKSAKKVEKEPKSQVVRLQVEHSQRLGELSDQFGVPQAQLMRWALEALFKKVEQSNGKLTLPFVIDSDQKQG